VVVGSRAEAKALRKAADASERQKAAAHKSTQRRAQIVQTSAALDATAAADGTAVWTLADAITILAVLAVSLIAKQAALASSVVEVMPPAGQVVARAMLLGAFYSVQVAALAFLASRHGMRMGRAFGLGRLGRSWRHRAISVGLVLLLLVVTRAAALIWVAFARAIHWTPPVRADLTVVFGAGGAGLALSILMVVVAAPIVEEMVFRGIMMHALGRRWGMWPAVVGSSLVFALSHATAWALAPTLVLGVALGWLAWTRESLWPSIALHAMYNSVVVAAAFWLVS
jgi:membrane protease YdiL (CAAX protease family)